LQLYRINDDMLAIGRAKWSLETTSLQTLHPNSESVPVPVHELDTIATQVEEHEHSSIANIKMKIGLDDSEQPVEALSHIDGLGVQIDFDLWADSEHLGDPFQDERQ